MSSIIRISAVAIVLMIPGKAFSESSSESSDQVVDVTTPTIVITGKNPSAKEIQNRDERFELPEHASKDLVKKKQLLDQGKTRLAKVEDGFVESLERLQFGVPSDRKKITELQARYEQELDSLEEIEADFYNDKLLFEDDKVIESLGSLTSTSPVVAKK